MEFVWIKPGTFEMGSPLSEKDRHDNETQHTVKLTKGFYMQTTEVTQKQFMTIMGYNPSGFKDCGGDCPVEGTRWNMVNEFITKLSKLQNKYVYSLPTEAQWEYAARGGTKTAYCFGDKATKIFGADPLDEYAWWSGNASSTTHKVALKKPNKFGLYDMHGNVWEWCKDWFGEYPSGIAADPKGLESHFDAYRVVRGGAAGAGMQGAAAVRNATTTFPITGSKTWGFALLQLSTAGKGIIEWIIHEVPQAHRPGTKIYAEIRWCWGKFPQVVMSILYNFLLVPKFKLGNA